MNTFSAIVVDDEPLYQRGLEFLLDADPEVRVVASCDNGEVAVDRIRELRPDIVFLDVQMPHLNGFEMLEALDSSERPQVVFISGNDQDALRAFDVSAVDYLLKPFDGARFETALGRAKAAVRQQRASLLTEQVKQLLHYVKELKASALPIFSGEALSSVTEQLVLKVGGALLFMKPADIVWIEAQRDFVKVQTAAKTQLVRETLQSLESRLDASKFLRIHRSFLINLDHVERVETAHYGDYSVYMSDGAKLRLSRSYRSKLKALTNSGTCIGGHSLSASRAS